GRGPPFQGDLGRTGGVRSRPGRFEGARVETVGGEAARTEAARGEAVSLDFGRASRRGDRDGSAGVVQFGIAPSPVYPTSEFVKCCSADAPGGCGPSFSPRAVPAPRGGGAAASPRRRCRPRSWTRPPNP